MSEIKQYIVNGLTRLKVSGQDAMNFLQGQCTQDISQLTPHQATPAAFCTAKGRAVTNVWLVRTLAEEPTVELLCAQSSADILYSHLRKYAAFFRGTTMTLMEDSGLCVGLAGEGAEALALRLCADQPQSLHALLPDQRCLLWLPAEAEAELAQQATSPRLSGEQWAQLDIESKILWLGADQAERWIPQNFSLDELGGISFKKGCYTGQEVIARLHYKGQSKKRLYAVKWRESSAAGNELFQNGKAIGDVIQHVTSNAEHYALAIIRVDAIDGEIFADENQQVPVQMLH